MEGLRLQRTLGYRPGQRIAWVDPPATFPAALGPLPTGVRHAQDGLDCLHVFLKDAAGAEDAVARWAARLDPHGCLWISWPLDHPVLDEQSVCDIGRRAGLTDVRRCTLLEWGAMKFVPHKRRGRTAPAPQPF